MKVTTESTLGNYLATVSIEADSALQSVLLPLGLKYVLQRQTTIDKTLGGFTKSADGKLKRKVGWKRTDVDFTGSMAESLQAALSTLAMPDETTITPQVAVVEYVREVAEKKYAAASKAMLKHESKGDLESWLKDKCAYVGATHGADGEYAVDALKAVDAFIVSLLAAV